MVELDVLISPSDKENKGDFLRFKSSEKEKQEKLNRLLSNRKIMQALRNGVKEGLKYGPKLHCPVSILTLKNPTEMDSCLNFSCLPADFNQFCYML